MATNQKDLQQRMRDAQGIPANPEIRARMAQVEQPATPPAVEPATPEEQGLNPAPAEDFFGNLAASMDNEVSSSPEPFPQQQQPQQPRSIVEELLYEAPVHQRQAGELPESLEPQPAEQVPLEAAIEQPMVEEQLRLTAEEWAQRQRAQLPPQVPQQQPQMPQLDPAELEKRAIDQLMTTEYALSEDEKTALISEPDTVIPKLAARMHVRMQVQTAQQLAQILPGMIQAQIQQASKVQSLERQFFDKYKELDKPEYRQTVAESLMLIRQVNPQADREAVMRDGAALAAVRLRTRLGGQQQPGSYQQPQSQMPLGGPGTVTRPQPQGPFTPAHTGGSEPVVPTDPNQDNIFAILANDKDW